MRRRDRRGEGGVAVWASIPLHGAMYVPCMNSWIDDLWQRIIGEKFECTCDFCDPVNGKRPNPNARYWDGTCYNVRGTPTSCRGTNDARRAVPCDQAPGRGTPTPGEILT